MKKILQKDEKILRQRAKEIPVGKINTPRIKKIIGEMSASLKSQSDGVAIAAPQIGYSLRIFVVSGKVFEKNFGKIKEGGLSDDSAAPSSEVKDSVFINPKISKLSREKTWLPEGCLSVRWLYGKTYRSKKATIEAYDEQGKKLRRGASGLLAQIFQHETDHLNGILFLDHAKDLKEEQPK